MAGLVETVARAVAIADAKPGQTQLLLTSKNYMSATRKLAKAAIAAVLDDMAEPSAGMLEAGHGGGINAEYTKLVWQAMLAQYRKEMLG